MLSGVIVTNKRNFVALLCACAGIGLVLFRYMDISEVLGLGVRATWAMKDFGSAVYYPVVAFLSGENPYDAERFLQLYPVSHPFPLYPPAALLVHLPLGFFSAQVASLIYFSFTLMLTFLLAFVSLYFNRIEAKIADVLLIGGVLLLSRPG